MNRIAACLAATSVAATSAAVTSAAVAIAALTAAGCGPTISGPTGAGPTAASERDRTLDGRYACMVEVGERAGVPAPCTISSHSGSSTLHSSGDRQLRGVVTATEAGLRFSGELMLGSSGLPRQIEAELFGDDAIPGVYSGIAVLEEGELIRVELRRQR